MRKAAKYYNASKEHQPFARSLLLDSQHPNKAKARRIKRDKLLEANAAARAVQYKH